MLIDSHCHLDFPDYGEEREEVIARARSAGVGGMLTISTTLETFPNVLDVARGHEGIWCTVGVHPHEAQIDVKKATSEHLIELSGDPKVVGFGETGLDYFYDHSPRDLQQRAFKHHIAASRQTGLPLVVHTRDADADMAEILTHEQGEGAFPGLLHCFSSSPDLARTALDLGFYISISGIVTFKKADELRDIVKEIPLDRLLVETDAPFLAPIPKRGKRNEPAYVAHTAEFIARLRGIEADELARITSENFFALFSKADKSQLPVSSDRSAP